MIKQSVSLIVVTDGEALNWLPSESVSQCWLRRDNPEPLVSLDWSNFSLSSFSIFTVCIVSNHQQQQWTSSCFLVGKISSLNTPHIQKAAHSKSFDSHYRQNISHWILEQLMTMILLRMSVDSVALWLSAMTCTPFAHYKSLRWKSSIFNIQYSDIACF